MRTEQLRGPRHAKTCLRAYADSKGPDQPAHPRSLIGPSLFANRIIEYYRMHDLRAKVRMWLCVCAGELNMVIWHIFEGTLSIDTAHVYLDATDDNNRLLQTA